MCAQTARAWCVQGLCLCLFVGKHSGTQQHCVQFPSLFRMCALQVAFICYNLMVNHEKRRPRLCLKVMHILILPRSLHCAFKAHVMSRPGGNQGKRIPCLRTDRKIRHGLLEKRGSIRRGDGSPPPRQIHDTQVRETKEEDTPKTAVHTSPSPGIGGSLRGIIRRFLQLSQITL